MSTQPVIENNKKCSGCEACLQICPTGAIKMAKKDKCFAYPIVNKEKCTQCGLCDNICPTLKQREKTTHNIKVYEGFYLDDSERVSSASGGIATAISKRVIKSKGVVFGVRYAKDFKCCEYVRIENDDDIKNFKGSKYCESNKNDNYKRAKDELNKEKTVLFIGLPFDIAGLKAFLGKEYDNFTGKLKFDGEYLNGQVFS